MMDSLNNSGDNTDRVIVGETVNMIPPPNLLFEGNTAQVSQTLSPVDNLFPALVDCFGIILLGYLAGR